MIVSTGRVWLCTPPQFEAMPVGTEFSMLSTRLDLAGEFAGKYTLITKPSADDLSLLQLGWVDSPATYPNGEPVCPEGTLFTWQVKQPPEDPCAGFSNEQVLLSATLRGLI